MMPRRPIDRSYVCLRLEREAQFGRPDLRVRATGVVLVADVSGFTPLTSRFTEGEGGIEQLQLLLNDGFGRLIDAVTAYGGDVVGFAGDALTAYFLDDGSALPRAARAALTAQGSLRVSHREVPIRIGLAAGTVDFWTLGGVAGEYRHVMGGPAFADASISQSYARPGEVVVSKNDVAAPGIITEAANNDAVLTVIDVDVAAPRRDPDFHIAGNVESVDEVLHSFLPPAVTLRLSGGLDHISELRSVTSIFVVLPDFNETDANEVNALVQVCQRTLHEHGGSVTSIAVDEKGASIVAALGLPPRSHPDGPARAVAAASELAELLSDHQCRFAIGVATGITFCGAVGNDVRREYTVLGDAVNTAARLANVALEPGAGGLLVDEVTVSECETVWSFHTAQSVRVKGRPELVIARRPRSRRSRSEQAPVPMIGREQELAQTLELLPHAVVEIRGESGMGKSTLLDKIADEMTKNGRAVFRGGADELSFARVCHPWQPVIVGLLGADSSADGDPLDAWDAGWKPLAPLLNEMLGTDHSETSETIALDGGRRLDAMLDLLASVITTAAARRPLGILLDDAQWFDDASWDLMGRLVGLADIELVVGSQAFQHDLHDALHRRGDLRQILLNPLTRAETAEIVVAVHHDLIDRDDGAAVAELIHDRCQGHPFFTVEIAKALRNLMWADEDLEPIAAIEAIPASILSALTARIDRLTPDQSLTLKTASVVGASFGQETIAAVHPGGRTSDEIADDLATLAEHDMVRAVGNGYAFSHSFVRVAATEMMLPTQRAVLHSALAEHYSAVGPDPAMYATIANHRLQAGEERQAATAFKLASAYANRLGATRSSVELALRAVSALGVEIETDKKRRSALIRTETRRLDQLLAGRNPGDLAELPMLTDDRIEDVLSILLAAMPAAHRMDPSLMDLMALRGAILTMRFGRGRSAAGLISMYSIAHRSLDRDPLEAYEFSRLGMRLASELGPEDETRSLFLHCWFNAHRHEPLRATVELAEQGFEIGWPDTNPAFAAYSLATGVVHLAASGAPLGEVIRRGTAAAKRIGASHPVPLWYIKLETQVARAISGATNDPCSLTDAVWSEEELLERTNDETLRAHYHDAKMRLSYLTHDIEQAERHRREVSELSAAISGKAVEADHLVFASLTMVAAVSSAPEGRGVALDFVSDVVERLTRWQASCPANFDHKCALLRGALAILERRPRPARELLASARALAEANGFLQYVAIAAVAEADVVASLGLDDRPQRALAVKSFSEWGAGLRSESLASGSSTD